MKVILRILGFMKKYYVSTIYNGKGSYVKFLWEILKLKVITVYNQCHAPLFFIFRGNFYCDVSVNQLKSKQLSNTTKCQVTDFEETNNLHSLALAWGIITK
jgi:hypothetical protein